MTSGSTLGPVHLGEPVGPGVGTVETQQVRLFDASHPLILASGATLAEVDVAFETYGKLNADAQTRCPLPCLTGTPCCVFTTVPRSRWWDNLIGPGRPSTPPPVSCHRISSVLSGSTDRVDQSGHWSSRLYFRCQMAIRHCASGASRLWLPQVSRSRRWLVGACRCCMGAVPSR